MRWVALSTWLLLVSMAFFVAPASDPSTGALIVKMLTGDLAGVNLSVFALFNLMGVWPMIFVKVLAFDTTEQRVWRWPFVLGSFGAGAFALLPYLVLRRWGAPKRPADRWWLRVLGSRWLTVGLAVAALALIALFFFGGGLHEFGELLKTNQFAFVMSCDFIACSVAGGLLASERRAV